MKRLLTILIVSTMLLAACGGAASTDDSAPTRGHWDGNTFVSSYFGLRFAMTDEWTAVSNDEIADMFPDTGYVQPPDGAEITPDMYWMTETLGIFDMVATIGEPGALGNVTGSVTTAIRRLTDDVANLSATDLISVSMFDAGINYIPGDGPMRIGNLDWYYADYRVLGILGQRMLINLDGEFIRQITIGYANDDYLNVILAMFQAY